MTNKRRKISLDRLRTRGSWVQILPGAPEFPTIQCVRLLVQQPFLFGLQTIRDFSGLLVPNSDSPHEGAANTQSANNDLTREHLARHQSVLGPMQRARSGGSSRRRRCRPHSGNSQRPKRSVASRGAGRVVTKCLQHTLGSPGELLNDSGKSQAYRLRACQCRSPDRGASLCG